MLHAHTHTHAFIQRSFYSQALLQPLHKEAFTAKIFLQGSSYKQKLCIHRSFYSEKPVYRAALHTEALKNKKRTAFTQSSFYTLKPLLVHKPLRKGTLHTRGGTLHKRFYTQQLSHRSLYTDQLLHSEDFARRRLYTKKL